MMAFKNQKAIEAKVHSQLYTNISLLKHIYTPTKEFSAVFHKEMFVKNNSAAFQQVVYYLLSVLDQEQLQLKVKTWPVYDGKSETQFRVEVLSYLNELNGTYEDAGLPSILMSHIITPGGFRFTKYMLKLSQLVLYKHLKKMQTDSVAVLDRIHPNKNTTITGRNISNLKLVTIDIYRRICKTKDDFAAMVKEYEKEGERICEELRLNLEKIPVLKQKLSNLQLNMKENGPDSDKILDTEKDILALKEKVEIIRIMTEKINKIIELVMPILKQDLFFNYEPGMYPSEIADSVQELDLLHLFEKLNHFLQNNSLEVGTVTEANLKYNTKKFEYVIGHLQKGIYDLERLHGDLLKMTAHLETMNSEMRNTSLSEEVLAVPLESTDESTLGILALSD